MAKSMMDQDMLKVLYSEEQIRTRVQEMGDTLYEQFKDRNPLFLGVLKGSFIFIAVTFIRSSLIVERHDLGITQICLYLRRVGHTSIFILYLVHRDNLISKNAVTAGGEPPTAGTGL